MIGVRITKRPGECDWRTDVVSLHTGASDGTYCTVTATVEIPIPPHIVANVERLAEVRLEFVTKDDLKDAHADEDDGERVRKGELTVDGERGVVD